MTHYAATPLARLRPRPTRHSLYARARVFLHFLLFNYVSVQSSFFSDLEVED